MYGFEHQTIKLISSALKFVAMAGFWAGLHTSLDGLHHVLGVEQLATFESPIYKALSNRVSE